MDQQIDSEMERKRQRKRSSGTTIVCYMCREANHVSDDTCNTLFFDFCDFLATPSFARRFDLRGKPILQRGERVAGHGQALCKGAIDCGQGLLQGQPAMARPSAWVASHGQAPWRGGRHGLATYKGVTDYGHDPCKGATGCGQLAGRQPPTVMTACSAASARGCRQQGQRRRPQGQRRRPQGRSSLGRVTCHG
ncbi:hypothetical protein GW17_00025720 [Ensete ventricosum]|nr:hypothetical protein GW17_00025720 [Ensete ventricosum]